MLEHVFEFSNMFQHDTLSHSVSGPSSTKESSGICLGGDSDTWKTRTDAARMTLSKHFDTERDTPEAQVQPPQDLVLRMFRAPRLPRAQ